MEDLKETIFILGMISIAVPMIRIIWRYNKKGDRRVIWLLACISITFGFVFCVMQTENVILAVSVPWCEEDERAKDIEEKSDIRSLDTGGKLKLRNLYKYPDNWRKEYKKDEEFNCGFFWIGGNFGDNSYCDHPSATGL